VSNTVLRCFDMPCHLCFFSGAYKHIKGKGVKTIYLAQTGYHNMRATCMYACTRIFCENNVYAWLLKKKVCF